MDKLFRICQNLKKKLVKKTELLNDMMTLQVQTTETLFYIFLDFLLFVCNTAYLMTKKS